VLRSISSLVVGAVVYVVVVTIGTRVGTRRVGIVTGVVRIGRVSIRSL
jgi:hypothetical protein